MNKKTNPKLKFGKEKMIVVWHIMGKVGLKQTELWSRSVIMKGAVE